MKTLMLQDFNYKESISDYNVSQLAEQGELQNIPAVTCQDSIRLAGVSNEN